MAKYIGFVCNNTEFSEKSCVSAQQKEVQSGGKSYAIS